MGRVLQNKKRKSSRPKVTRKPKSKKQLIKNSIIAAHWDPKKTLSQNYKNLGLSTKLNRQTGGLEKKGLDRTKSEPLNLSTRPETRNANSEEVKIVKDPSTGEMRVIDGKKSRPNLLNDPLNDLDADSDESGHEQPAFSAHHLAHLPSTTTGADTIVVRQLEELAASGTRTAPRKQSEHEQDWCARMVEKHGDNYEAMFRDRKLNVMQQSVSDIRRRIRKWAGARQKAG